MGQNIMIYKTLNEDIFVFNFKTVKCKMKHSIFYDSVYVRLLLYVCCKSYVYVWMNIVVLSLYVFSPILPIIYRYFAFVL